MFDTVDWDIISDNLVVYMDHVHNHYQIQGQWDTWEYSSLYDLEHALDKYDRQLHTPVQINDDEMQLFEVDSYLNSKDYDKETQKMIKSFINHPSVQNTKGIVTINNNVIGIEVKEYEG